MMKYSSKLKSLIIPTEDADFLHDLIIRSLKMMRESAGLPLDKYKRNGCLTKHDYAAISLIEVAESIGLDFPVKPHQHNELDLRNCD